MLNGVPMPIRRRIRCPHDGTARSLAGKRRLLLLCPGLVAVDHTQEHHDHHICLQLNFSFVFNKKNENLIYETPVSSQEE